MGKQPSFQTEEQAARQQRLVRWALQAEARDILPNERVAQCLRAINPLSIGVEVLYAPIQHAAHYKSLIVCGSVWMCPLCAAKISERRREELAQAITRHTAQNGAVFMATYTVSHTRHDSLPCLLQAFLRARKHLKQGKAAQCAKDAFGVLGTISVLEVTWSRLNHWHPHTHELIFTIPGTGDVNLGRYERTIRRLWRQAAALEGLTMNRHGFRLDRTYGAVQDYIAKYGHEPLGKPWGVESEMTKGHLKRGRATVEHLTPFGLLYRIYEGRSELIPIFRDYARYFKGKHQLHWSSGLRKRLLGTDEEPTDEELAAAAVEDAELLGLLSRYQWRVVLANDARGDLLEVARSGDWEQVKVFLVEIGCSGLDDDPVNAA